MEFLYKNSPNLPYQKASETASQLAGYIADLKQSANDFDYKKPESFLSLPQDDKLLEDVKKLKEDFDLNKVKYVFLIGIGGSSLGTKAVYDALHGYYDNFSVRQPKIFFLETINPNKIFYLNNLFAKIDNVKEVLIIFISKSGKTLETLVNLNSVTAIWNRKFSNIEDRMIIISDEESEVSDYASQRGIKKFGIPGNVSGRFSVFSAAGLIPLFVSGCNIDLFREGAGEVSKSFFDQLERYPAVLSASILYLALQQGKVINENFFFHPELECLGKWLRQLLAESLGKTSPALTPIVSIGTDDLHSILQLDLGGPKDKVVSFVISKSFQENRFEAENGFPNSGINFSDKTDANVLKAIYESVKSSYEKNQIMFSEILLDDLTEKSLGSYMQFKMIETVLLAKLLSVNAFDQPDIEDYKDRSRKLLS